MAACASHSADPLGTALGSCCNGSDVVSLVETARLPVIRDRLDEHSAFVADALDACNQDLSAAGTRCRNLRARVNIGRARIFFFTDTSEHADGERRRPSPI